MNVNMKLSGTEEFHQALRALPNGVKAQVLGNAVAEIAAGFTKEIIATVPVDTGTLRESYVWEEQPVDGTKAKALIGTRKEGFYWSWVEFGRPGVAPRPYVRPAFDKWRRKTRKIIRTHFEKALGVAMRKARVRRAR